MAARIALHPDRKSRGYSQKLAASATRNSPASKGCGRNRPCREWGRYPSGSVECLGGYPTPPVPNAKDLPSCGYASSPLFFVEARGTPVFLAFALPPLREAERRETRRLCAASDWAAGEAARDTLARRVAPACDRGSAPLGAPPAAFSGTGRAFGGRRTWHTHHQPAPGGGVLVPPGRSPAPPGRGGCVSPARGRRVRLHHRDASRRRPQPSRTGIRTAYLGTIVNRNRNLFFGIL